MSQEKIGFIGLGNMGKPIADNIARAGFDMTVFDIAGTASRTPQGATAAASCAQVAAQSDAVFLCLPSLGSFAAVVAEIAAAEVTEHLVVVNTSTVGPVAAVEACERLKNKGIAYVDAAVSGSAFRAQEGMLSIMFSGPETLLQRLTPVLESFSANIFNIGAETGQGQRMKLVNNCLVISSFVMTAQALAFGEKGGLDLKTMLDVVNASSGQNFVTEHHFPRFALNESYDSAGATAIIQKDMSLFIDAAKKEGCRHDAAEAIFKVVDALEEAYPGGDQMLIYPFTRDGKQPAKRR